MALSILRNGVPLDQLYGPKGASTAAATGCMQNGVDVNQYLLALADGKALGFNSGISKNSTDFSAIFGVLATSLPVNGYNLISTCTVGSLLTSNTATLTFTANASTWTVSVNGTGGGASVVYGTAPSGGPSTGSVPAGAATVQYSYTASGSSSGGTQSTTNGASSATVLSSSPSIVFTESRAGGPSTPSGTTGNWSFTITFRNASGAVISTTNCQVQCNCQA